LGCGTAPGGPGSTSPPLQTTTTTTKKKKNNHRIHKEENLPNNLML
jgi:hypothetical protein